MLKRSNILSIGSLVEDILIFFVLFNFIMTLYAKYKATYRLCFKNKKLKSIIINTQGQHKN